MPRSGPEVSYVGTRAHIYYDRAPARLERCESVRKLVKHAELAVRAKGDVLSGWADGTAKAVEDAFVLVNIHEPLPQVLVHLKRAQRLLSLPDVPDTAVHVVARADVYAVGCKLERAGGPDEFREESPVCRVLHTPTLVGTLRLTQARCPHT